MTMLLSALVTVGLTNANTIKCPDSVPGDSVTWSGADVGLSVFSSSSSRGADCFLRHSTDYPASGPIDSEWIDPTANTLVFSHGWSPGMGDDHAPIDQWSDNESITGDGCVSSANPGNNPEPCEPEDYDPSFWTAQGWNVIYLDWRYYADTLDVVDAEERIYQNVQGSNNVVDLLFDELIEFLDMSGWNGDELRIAGHSLGSQIALNLAAKIKTSSASSAYKNKLTRIALLDHFFSNWAKDFLPQSDPSCSDWWWWPCDHIWVSEYALDYLLKDIGADTVIESYRTSPVSSTVFVGDSADEFNKRTVFAELKPWFYNSLALDAKHRAAIPMYLHCMKWWAYGPLNNNAPSCRMSTEVLKAKCPTNNWRGNCDKRYEQIGDSAAYTTQDFDDNFNEYNV